MKFLLLVKDMFDIIYMYRFEGEKRVWADADWLSIPDYLQLAQTCPLILFLRNKWRLILCGLKLVGYRYLEPTLLTSLAHFFI